MYLYLPCLFESVGRLCLYSSYVAKENEHRLTLGLQEGDSSIELEDNEELIQLGMMVEAT